MLLFEPRSSQMSPTTLNRKLQDGDWSRLLSHSKYTRVIDFCFSKPLLDLAPPEIWRHSLWSASFPSLESLSVHAFDSLVQAPINIIPSLLRPSLRSIKLSTWTPAEDCPLISALRVIAENETVSLDNLDLHFKWKPSALADVGLQAIASQTHLRRLVIHEFSTIGNLVARAKDLPFLEELDVRDVEQGTGLRGENRHDMGFHSLTTLTASGSAAMIHTLLRSIGSEHLAQVALFSEDWRGGEIYREVMAELQRFRPHLVRLQLTARARFTWKALEPTLNLAELQAFDLDYDYTDSTSDEVTDNRLQQMIDAWPNLARLRLQSDPPHVTLTSLAYIATHRPGLKKLAIAVDARKEKNSLFSREIEICQFAKNTLEVLDVMGSRFDEGQEGRWANDILRLWWPQARLCQSYQDWRATVHWDIPDAGALSWPCEPEV